MNSENTKKAGDEKIRALIVDDEQRIAQLIAMTLRYEGWEVETANTGEEASEKLESFKPDVAVLDIKLPDTDGMTLLSNWRAGGNLVPVLFLTGLSSVDDRVNGLTVGGDDYVVKPFSLEELVARLRGLIRRAQIQVRQRPDAKLRVGDLELNEENYEVQRAGKPIDLTTTEFELLRYLMRNAGRVVSKAQILDRVWSYDFTGKATVVELYISYLRRKVDEQGEPMINTVRGAGYVLKEAKN